MPAATLGCAAAIANASCLLEGTPGFTGSDASSGSTEDPSSGDASGSTGDTDDAPQPPPRGVIERERCGLDLDDDGIVNTADDCNVCSWQVTPPPVDPDGDGVEERVMWVDCGAGADDGDCRDRDAPCSSLRYALDMLPAKADADNFESIVCFTGTCEIDGPLGLPSGLVGGITKGDFEYPRDPVLVMGTDRDGDGIHPPQDDDDVATIVTTREGHDAVAFAFDAPGPDEIARDIELAHFRLVAGAPDVRLVRNRYNPTLERIYFHDLEIVGLRAGEPENPDAALFELALAGDGELYADSRITGFALENTRFIDFGGTLIRADTASGVAQGPIRIANVEATASGCDASTCTGYYDDTMLVPQAAKVSILELYGEHADVTVVDSIFDAQTDEWTPYGGDGGVGVTLTAFTFGECTSDLVVRNNEIRGFATALRLEATSAARCTNGGMGDVRFESNLVIGNDGASRLNTAAILPIDIRSRPLDNGEARGNVGAVDLLNNAILPLEPSAGCIAIAAAFVGAPSGPFTIQHDTCIVDLDPIASQGAVVRVWGDVAIDVVDLRNSVLLGNAGTPVVRASEIGAGWRVDANVVGTEATFSAEGVDESLTAWQSRGFDVSSVDCTPTFLGDGYHLDAVDVCAVDRGLVDVALETDIDGETRSGTPDIGADERTP